jgi:serine O-acetyltransferase
MRSPLTGWPTGCTTAGSLFCPGSFPTCLASSPVLKFTLALVWAKGVFIDHGMGVVIGETAIVGDYTLIYQGVTLGGTGKEIGKRHPTVGSRVVIGTGAKVLGNIHIGDYARVGAGSVVLRNVPANCTAVGIPNRNVCRCNTVVAPLEHSQLPDADAKTLRQLLDRIEALEAQVKTLSRSSLPSLEFAPHE